MASWSIEHIPAGGGASTFASLETWGFAALQMQFVNWGVDRASITARGGSIAFEAAKFGYKDKIVVWRDGVRFAHFWVTGLGAAAQMQESRTYILSGPAWWLAQLPFRWPLWPVKSTIEDSEKTGAMWLQYALASAIGHGAPLAHETPTTGYAQFDAPAGDLSASRTCLEVVQRAARVHPMSSGTWDMAGEVPSFVVRTRSHLAAQSIAVSDSIETFGLMPNPELQAESVQIEYIYGDDATVGSVNYAGTNAGMHGPNRLHVAVPVADAGAAWRAAFLPIAQRLYEGLGVLIWTGAINFHETSPDTPIPHVSPGSCVNLTGGLAEWESMNACAQSVVWSVSPENNDLCSVTLGAPEQLGVQDFLDFAAAGYTSAACAGGNPGPYDPPLPPPNQDAPVPGTYDDLNGGTGGGTPEGIIAVQARGGPWSYCGYAPYDGVEDSPPLRYRTETPSGTVVRKDYDSLHETLLATCTDTPIGPRTWVGCTEPTAGLWQSVQTAGGFCEASTTEIDEPPSTAAYVAVGHLVRTYTNTCGAIGNGLGCCGNALGWCGVEYCGNATRTLSNPDTPDAAIARMLATAEWGAATTAIRTVPATTITGLYREARYRTEHTEGTGESAVAYPTLERLEPWQRYQVTVTLESRPVDEAGTPTGDGSWSAAGTRRHYFIADLDGEGGIDWQVVEPTAGYETRIASTLVEVA